MLGFLLPRRIARFLRPGAYLRRKAVYGGIFGRNRKWMIVGGLAWVFYWLDQLITGGEPTAKYTRDIDPGERVFVVHEPTSPRAAKKQAKQQRKAAKRAL